MSNLIVPAEYARRQCGLFIEIAASNIDTGNLECHEKCDGDVKKMTALDFAPIVVREPDPGRFVLVKDEEFCRFRKQVALGKRWILALDQDDPNYQQIANEYILGDELHVLTLSAVALSWEVDPGLEHPGLRGDINIWDIWEKDIGVGEYTFLKMFAAFPLKGQLDMLKLYSTRGIRCKLIAPVLEKLVGRVDKLLIDCD